MAKPQDDPDTHSSKKKTGSKEKIKWDFSSPKFWNYFFKEWVLTVGLAFAVAFLFRSTIASPRHIPTGSMSPTIKIGEFIFVNMFSFNWHLPYTRKILVERRDPERGEIVVFEYPQDPDKDYIKRVVGIPGDTVELRNKRVILNGQPLPLEAVEDRSILADLAPKYDPERISLYQETNGNHRYYVIHLNDDQSGNFGPVTVPPGNYFVMGDNRDDSYDSRFWGPLEREKIFGTGTIIWLSVDIHNFPWIRGERLFTMLR
jgi:signal peptidase I